MRNNKIISCVLMSLSAYGVAVSMPVEDLTTETGVWATLGKMGIEIEHSTTMVAQQAALVQSSYAQIKNFDFKSPNNMADAMNMANQASRLGSSLSSNADQSIGQINDMTKDQDNPEGRLKGYDTVLDTAKATFKFSEEQSQYTQKNIDSLNAISNAGGDVAGTTSAIQAGNEIAIQTNQQLQALDRSIGQQSRMIAAKNAAEAAQRKAQEERMQKISDSIRNVGSDQYKGEKVDIPAWKFNG